MENERHTGESSAGVALYIRRHPGMSTQEIEAALGISFDPGRFGSVAMPMDRVEYRDGGWWPREAQPPYEGCGEEIADILAGAKRVPGSGFARLPVLMEAIGTEATRQIMVDALRRNDLRPPLYILADFLAIAQFLPQPYPLTGTEIQIDGSGWEPKLATVLMEMLRLDGLETAVRALHPRNLCMRKRNLVVEPDTYLNVPCGECPECRVHAALEAQS